MHCAFCWTPEYMNAIEIENEKKNEHHHIYASSRVCGNQMSEKC